MDRSINKSLEDGTHLYETEYRAYHLEREVLELLNYNFHPTNPYRDTNTLKSEIHFTY